MKRLQAFWNTRNGKIIILGGLGLLILLCCIIPALLPEAPPYEPAPTNTPVPPTPQPTPTSIADAAQIYLNEYGGVLDSYIEILSMTDCVALQEKFEIAYTNNQRETAGTPLFKITLGYMKATDEHMREIGCYE